MKCAVFRMIVVVRSMSVTVGKTEVTMLTQKPLWASDFSAEKAEKVKIITIKRTGHKNASFGLNL